MIDYIREGAKPIYHQRWQTYAHGEMEEHRDGVQPLVREKLCLSICSAMQLCLHTGLQ